jgi:hypothetical protein
MGGLFSKPKPKSSSYQELPDAPNPPPYNPKDETRLSKAVHMLTRAGYTFLPGDETTQVLAGLGWLKAECAQATDGSVKSRRGQMTACERCK